MSESLIAVLRSIDARLERLERAVGEPRRRRRSPAHQPLTEDRERAILGVVTAWHHRVGDRALTTREVVALGLAGLPKGTLCAVARELTAWSRTSYRALGSAEVYQLRAGTRHKQAVWSVKLS